MDYRDRTFENESILLDGNTFSGCTFRNCRLVFKGMSPVSMMVNQMEGVHWVMEGPAAATIAFMTAIYHGAGEGGRELIEQTFANIRRGSHD